MNAELYEYLSSQIAEVFGDRHGVARQRVDEYIERCVREALNRDRVHLAQLRRMRDGLDRKIDEFVEKGGRAEAEDPEAVAREIFPDPEAP